MSPQNSFSFKKMLWYLILLIITILGSYFGIVAINSLKDDEAKNINQGVLLNISDQDLSNINVTTETTELEKFQTLKGQQSIEIVSERLKSPEFSATDQDANNNIALSFLQKNSKKLTINGSITGGYLYIKAGAGSADDIGTIAPNESVYIYLGSKGGHLYKPKSLISTPTEDGFTQYLFKLDKIYFTHIPYSDENKFTDDDWLDRLNKNTELLIGTFVSSASRFAVIEEVTIAYEGGGEITIK